MAEELGTPLASQTKGEEEDGYKKTRKPPKKAYFLRADVEDCSEAAREFNVEVLPSILLIRYSVNFILKIIHFLSNAFGDHKTVCVILLIFLLLLLLLLLLCCCFFVAVVVVAAAAVVVSATLNFRIFDRETLKKNDTIFCEQFQLCVIIMSVNNYSNHIYIFAKHRRGQVEDCFIGQQLGSVREAMERIHREEEDEDIEEEEEENSSDLLDAAEDKSMRLRKVSAALEAVVTDAGMGFAGRPGEAGR